MGDFELRPPTLDSDRPVRQPRLLDQELQLNPPAPLIPSPTLPPSTPPNPAQLRGVFDHYTDPPARAPSPSPPIRVTGGGEVAGQPGAPTGSVNLRAQAEGRNASLEAEGSVDNEGTVEAEGTAGVGTEALRGQVRGGVERSSDGETEGSVSGELRARPIPQLDLRARGGASGLGTDEASGEASGEVRVRPVPGVELRAGGGATGLGTDEASGNVSGGVTLGGERGPQLRVEGGASGLGTDEASGRVEGGLRLPVAPGVQLDLSGGADGLGTDPRGRVRGQLNARLNESLDLTAGAGASDLGGSNPEVNATLGIRGRF